MLRSLNRSIVVASRGLQVSRQPRQNQPTSLSNTRTNVRASLSSQSSQAILVRSFSTTAGDASTSNTPSSEKFYDVVIIGGGLVGASLACALKTAPYGKDLRILAIDGAKPPKAPSAYPDYIPKTASSEGQTPQPTLRTVALSPQSVSILKRIGVWKNILATGRVGRYPQMIVWDCFSDVTNKVEWHTRDQSVFGDEFIKGLSTSNDGSVDATEDADEALGYVVENDVLHAHLAAYMAHIAKQENPNATATDANIINTDSSTGCLDIMYDAPVADIVFPDILTPLTAAHTANAATATASDAYASFPAVTLASGATLRARLIVGADGNASTVKKAAGIGSHGWDYNQRACVANVKTAQPITTAYQRMLASGPVAILPLYGDVCNIVWSSSPDHAMYLAKCSEEEYIQHLNTALHAPARAFATGTWSPNESATASVDKIITNNALGEIFKSIAAIPANLANFWRQPLPDSMSRLLPLVLNAPLPQTATKTDANTSINHPHVKPATSGPYDEQGTPRPPAVTAVLGPRAGFPLRMISADNYVKSRVVLLGDAAHVVHPMAGQGVNLGFGDIDALVRTVGVALTTGADIGDFAVLRQYEREQKLVNAVSMTGIDALQKTFKIEDGPLAALRGLGVTLFNSSNTLKRVAAQVAMGIKKD